MIMRFLLLITIVTAAFPQVVKMDQSPRHLDFSLVHGTAIFMPAKREEMAPIAPYAVVAFTAKDGHKTFFRTDYNGDYAAVLQPGYYCLSAYDLNTGNIIPIDPTQLKCIDVIKSKDVELDVRLDNVVTH